jgi:hypothetical protein
MINIHFSRCEVEKRENVKTRKRENLKTRKRENFAFRELHEVHNAKAFFAFSRFRVFAFLRRELHVSKKMILYFMKIKIEVKKALTY